MWPDHPFDFVKIPNDSEGVHFGLFVESQLIAVVSLFVTAQGVQFRKLATETDYQGLGFGSAIMRHVIDWAKSQGHLRLWCNARAGKTSFYENFGMTKTDVTYEKGGLSFVVMELVI